MNVDPSPPVDGPVILAVQRYGGAERFKAMSRVVGPYALTVLALAGVAIGLLIGALIQGQTAALVWLAPGPLGCAAAFLVGFVVSRGQRREEGRVVLFDRLAEYTRSGALGERVSVKGKLAWLTDSGLCFAGGRQEAWSQVDRVSVSRVGSRAHRI